MRQRRPVFLMRTWMGVSVFGLIGFSVIGDFFTPSVLIGGGGPPEKKWSSKPAAITLTQRGVLGPGIVDPSPRVDSEKFQTLWMAMRASTTDDPPPMALWSGMRMLAERNPQVRAEIMQRYMTDNDEESKRRLRTLLFWVSTPDVEQFAEHLAIASDPTQRRDAFLLLRARQDQSIAARKVLRQGLRTEQDSDVLSAIVGALQTMPVDDDGAEDVIDQLQSLVHHPTPEVRAASLRALAHWNGAGSKGSFARN